MSSSRAVRKACRPPEQKPIVPTFPFDVGSDRSQRTAPAASPTNRASGTPPLARAVAAASSGSAPGASLLYRFMQIAL
jgi:hypothetical protein